MADTNENQRNWLVAERNGEFKVFARLEWKELDPEGWKILADDLTEEEASKELVKRAPPDKRVS